MNKLSKDTANFYIVVDMNYVRSMMDSSPQVARQADTWTPCTLRLGLLTVYAQEELGISQQELGIK